MNGHKTTSEWKFLKEIDPLEFDPGLLSEYLESFSSDTKKIALLEELNEHYRHVENPAERISMMEMIGQGLIFYDESDFEEGEAD